MKKLLSLVLVLCMACMLIPAMAEESAAGTWYLVEMTQNGVVINPAEMGMNWTITLNEDGTASNSMTMMGETQEKEGTWTQEGETVTITIDDQPQAFTLTDGNLIPADESMPAVFSKEAPAVAEKPAPVAAESEDAFVGEWDMTAIDMMGMYMTKDLLEAAGTGLDGFSVKLSIQPGRVTAVSKSSADAEEQTVTYESTFEDGKLTFKIDLGEAASSAESLGLDISGITDGVSTIQLLDNGGILYGMNFMGMEIGVYLARQ